MIGSVVASDSMCGRRYQVYEQVADFLQQNHHPAGLTVEL